MKKLQHLKKYAPVIGILLVLFVLIVRNLIAYNEHMIQNQQKEFLRLARSMTYGGRTAAGQ